MVLDIGEGRAARSAAAAASKGLAAWRPSAALGARRLALATRQLAALTAVSPVEEAVRNLADQAERPVERPSSLWSAFAHPGRTPAVRRHG